MNSARKKPRKKRKKRNNSRPDEFQHPFPRLRHPTVRMMIPLLVLLCSLVAVPARLQTAQPDEPKKKQRLADQFLIFGTVFEESGFLLPGAEIRVSRAGEKKVGWRQYSDRRGEFGVRVPTGAEYELTVKAKGFEEQSRKVDARSGSREDLVFRMKPLPGGKKK